MVLQNGAAMISAISLGVSPLRLSKKSAIYAMTSVSVCKVHL